MEKCLEKKYYKNVNNGDLPFYGKASINLVESDENYLLYIVSANGAIHVNSRVPMLPYGTQDKVMSLTINSGSAKYLTIDKSDIPSSAYLENIVEIDNMYNCSCFVANGGAPYYHSFFDKATLRNNLKGMWKNAPLEIADISEEDLGVELNESVYYLSINNKSRKYLDLSKYMELPNIEYITGGYNGVSLRIDLQEANRDSELLYLFATVLSGSKVEFLPYMLRFIYAYGLEGNIEDYVTMARSKGRINGALVFGGAVNGTNNIKYQDAGFKNLWDNNTIPHIPVYGASDVACLSWTQSAMEWSDSIPEGYLGKGLSPSAYRSQHNS